MENNDTQFKFNGDTMIVESGRISECVQYINNKSISKLYICDLYYNLNNLDFIKECHDITSININCYTINQLDELYELSNLKEIILQDIDCIVDLSRFQNLESFLGSWNKNYINLASLLHLNNLRLDNYNPKSKTLNDLAVFNELKSLMLVKSTIESLDGIDKMPDLTNASFYYINKLSSLKYINGAKNLESITFEACKRISDFEILQNNKLLQSIKIFNCGAIKSIGFIKRLPELVHFSCLKTDILDEDIDPCFSLNYYAVDKKYIK